MLAPGKLKVAAISGQEMLFLVTSSLPVFTYKQGGWGGGVVAARI